jgi:hypothetical protein
MSHALVFCSSFYLHTLHTLLLSPISEPTVFICLHSTHFLVLVLFVFLGEEAPEFWQSKHMSEPPENSQDNFLGFLQLLHNLYPDDEGFCTSGASLSVATTQNSLSCSLLSSSFPGISCIWAESRSAYFFERWDCLSLRRTSFACIGSKLFSMLSSIYSSLSIFYVEIPYAYVFVISIFSLKIMSVPAQQEILNIQTKKRQELIAELINQLNQLTPGSRDISISDFNVNTDLFNRMMIANEVPEVYHDTYFKIYVIMRFLISMYGNFHKYINDVDVVNKFRSG